MKMYGFFFFFPTHMWLFAVENAFAPPPSSTYCIHEELWVVGTVISDLSPSCAGTEKKNQLFQMHKISIKEVFYQ